MPLLDALSVPDWVALAAFFVAWIAYEPLLKAVGRGRNLINTDMTVIRLGWMRRAVTRDVPLVDSQIVGNVLNSNSFFASSNLLLIAGAAGLLFNADSFASASDLVAIKTSSRALFEAQIGLVLVCLARGLLAFIWSIRQLNYCLAAIGASPGDKAPTLEQEEYARAVAGLITPALSAFNSGVRGYYFAMAAAAWLFGPYAFMLATLGAVGLLFWRQRGSPTSAAVAQIRRLLEERDDRG